MKLLHTLSIAFAALLVSVLTSCSAREDILDKIPANVASVATINVDKLCSAGGITFNSDGTYECVEALKPLFTTGAFGDFIGKLAYMKADNIIDLNNVAVAFDTDYNVYIGLYISSVDECKEMLSEAIWNESDGYNITRTEGCSVLLKGHQMWAVSKNDDAVKALEAFFKRAKELPISRYDGVTQTLTGDNMVNIIVNNGFISDGNTDMPLSGSEWSVGSLLSGADNSLVLDWEIMESTGRTVKPKGWQNINPALLAYVPAHFNMVFAAGVTAEFDWEPVRRIVTMLGGFQTAAFMSVVNPYLQSVNGTVLIAAGMPEGIASGDFDITDGDFLVMARMPQNRINQLMNMITEMMASAGMRPSVTADGLIAVPQYGKTMYIGNVDGYLGISTIGFDNTRNNSLAPVFVNKDLAFDFSLNPYSAYVPEAPQGTALNFSVAMDNGKGAAKLKVEGTQYSPIVFLLTAAK